MAVRLSAFTRRQPFTPQEYSWYSFLLEAEWPQGHSAAGSIRSIEKSNDLIGNRTRDLPACSVVPQPTTLPPAPLRRLLRWLMTMNLKDVKGDIVPVFVWKCRKTTTEYEDSYIFGYNAVYTLKFNWRFGGICRLHLQGREGESRAQLATCFHATYLIGLFFSTQKMEATCSSEARVDFQWITWRYIFQKMALLIPIAVRSSDSTL
jgi:hypothetical protein